MRKATMRRLLALSAAAVLVMATGCASLPRSGAVRSYTPDSPETSTLVQSARGPVKDSSPEVLVRDFLRACAAGNFDDYAKAKLYLTDEAVAKWKPDAIVNVISAESGPSVSFDKGVARVSASLNSTVLKNGIRSMAQPGTALNQQMTLTKNADGQWRISELDQGIIIPLGTFETAYTRRPLYFLTPDLEDLVPDPRWYPRQDITVHLVQGLLDGPSKYLAPAVRNFVPKDTKLLTNSVDIDSGRATVTLSENILNIPPQAQTEMYRQFSRTLTGVTQISMVQLQVGETVIGGIRGTGGSIPYDFTTLIGEDSDGNLVMQPGTDSPQVILKDVASRKIYGATISPVDSKLIAAREGGNSIVRIDADKDTATPIFTDNNLVDPSIDRLGWIWTASSDSAQSVYALRQSDPPFRIPIESDSNSDLGNLKAIRVSVDGSRAAIVFQKGRVATVKIYAIHRDSSGAPLSLENPEPVVVDLNSYEEIAWINQTTLGISGQFGPIGTTPINKVAQVMVGGGVQVFNIPNGADWIVGGSGNGQMVVSDPSGAMYSRVGNSWHLMSSDLIRASYPG